MSAITSGDDVRTGSRAVLVLDLSQNYPEISTPNPLSGFSDGENFDVPSLSDVIRLIQKAKSDSAVKGMYINCGGNANGFANNNELRNAVIDFSDYTTELFFPYISKKRNLCFVHGQRLNKING